MSTPSPKATTTYELELSPGRTVAFRELTVEEFESLIRQVGDKDTNWELTQMGLRRSLVRDGTEELTYTKLVGNQLNERFRTPQLLLLRNAWESVHLPKPEDLARVRAMKVVAG
jgi:hypothetical protein